MKRLFLLLFIPLVLWGCSKESGSIITPNKPDQPEIMDSDSVEVRLTAIGDFTATPLSSRASSKDDLYALMVTQITPEDGYIGSEPTVVYSHNYYAIGVFDDLNLAVVKLSKKYKYGFDLAYIPNGKKILHKYPNGSYGNPCYAHHNPSLCPNEIRYTTTDFLWIQYGNSQVKGIDNYMVQENYWNNVCRYQGYVDFFDPNVSDEVKIDLYKQVVGFKLIIDDFTKGEISIQGQFDTAHTYSIKPSANSTTNTLQVEIEMPEIRSTISNTDTTNPLSTIVQIWYDDGDGNRIPLYRKQNFQYDRNVLYTLRFSLSDAIANGGITANIIDDTDEMTEQPFEI